MLYALTIVIGKFNEHNYITLLLVVADSAPLSFLPAPVEKIDLKISLSDQSVNILNLINFLVI